MGDHHYQAGEVIHAGSQGKVPAWSTTPIPCPFCKMPLDLLENVHEVTFCRVAVSCTGEGQCNGLADILPRTHDALHCEDCERWMFLIRES
jgi:uncharacterized protein YbaR (Trm112 family)